MVNFKKMQVDRQSYILSRCAGKRVLNVGCLAADRQSMLHKKIVLAADYCIGLDIHEADLPDYIKGNVEDFESEEKFDLIIIGEVIEHLWNLKGCIESCFSALSQGGSLIITTPNAYAPIFLKNAILGKPVNNDPGHTLLFDVTTLTNLFNNYTHNIFSGSLVYYEEEEADTVPYRLQRLLAKINIGYSRGLLIDLKKNDV
jgi:2-polyprenyl-3-methyl-5-hydroxy-6-metoxy-1,4-benzoquinol methylase